MAVWHYRIELADLHRQHENGILSISNVGETLAERIENEARGMRHSVAQEFRKVAEDFAAVDDVDEYDNCLERLYNLGDAYRCWIASF